MKLSVTAEEVALFFAQMLDHEYTTKKVFRENFFKDWRKVKPERHQLCFIWKDEIYVTVTCITGVCLVVSLHQSPKAYHAELILRFLVFSALENTICVRALIC